MAILQISQIQVRRGLYQDLPQLASGELGWSIDSQQLFIGNGTTSEGAPSVGVTQVLTEHTNLADFLGSYQYRGLSAGFPAITGIDATHPTVRTLQDKLDDFANVKDFGAIGDGATDDTAAISRAIQNAYAINQYSTGSNFHKTIYFPAGTYLISRTLSLPPYTRLQGDGKRVSVITGSFAGTLVRFADSLGQIGIYYGQPDSFGNYPNDKEYHLNDLSIKHLALTSGSSCLTIDGGQTIKFNQLEFTANTNGNGNLVVIADGTLPAKNITFFNSSFYNANYGISATVRSIGGVSAIRISHCYFDNITSAAYYVDNNVNGVTSIGNFYGNSVTLARNTNTNTTHVALDGGNLAGNLTTGLFLGRMNVGVTRVVSVSSSVGANVAVLGTGTGIIDYQLDNGSSYRIGTFKFTNTGTAVTYDDEYNETGTSLGAVLSLGLYANTAGNLFCTTTSTANFKYSLKQFL